MLLLHQVDQLPTQSLSGVSRIVIGVFIGAYLCCSLTESKTAASASRPPSGEYIRESTTRTMHHGDSGPPGSSPANSAARVELQSIRHPTVDYRTSYQLSGVTRLLGIADWRLRGSQPDGGFQPWVRPVGPVDIDTTARRTGMDDDIEIPPPGHPGRRRYTADTVRGLAEPHSVGGSQPRVAGCAEALPELSGWRLDKPVPGPRSDPWAGL